MEKTIKEMEKSPMVIDTYEIEDMLGEYYDFSEVDDATWRAIDNEVKKLCNERGVSPTDDNYEDYARICDVAVGRVLPHIEE